MAKGLQDKLKNYAIGAGLGIVIYHWVLRSKYPTTFPALGTTLGTGCNNCGQQR